DVERRAARDQLQDLRLGSLEGLHLLLGRDVAADDDDRSDRRVVEHVDGGELEPNPHLLSMAAAELSHDRYAGKIEQTPELGFGLFELVGMSELEDRA